MRTILMPLILLAAPAGAQIADQTAIMRAAEAFAGGPAIPLDPRLRLAACQHDLALSWADPAQASVLVQCPAAGGWRLYVPLAREVRVASQTAAIQRGDPVTIVLGGEGFAISQQGEAMDAGAPGDWIRVRTLAGKAAPLRARVLRPGQAGIPLP